MADPEGWIRSEDGKALARTFKIIDGDLKHPHSEHWQRSFRIFDLLL